MRISIVTLGCKVNQFESQSLEENLGNRGHRMVPFGEPADAVVVNSCTVTHRSDRDVRALIRRARRTTPGARILVTGCYAQIDPEALHALGVDVIVGTGGKASIAELLESGASAVHLPALSRSGPLDAAPVGRFGGRTRAFFKVQEGCQAFCAYCIVPYARGPSRSLPLEAVRQGLRALSESGHREVVLTGVHLGLWGRDLDPPLPFTALLSEAETSGIPRVRLSSLEPREVTVEVVDRIVASDSLCPHLHIPLQSGSNRVLGAMGRPYTADEFRRAVTRAATAIPRLCLGFDVIVGFPGEDDTAFAETKRLLEDLPFAYLHVFPFSPRQGTQAWGMSDRVSDSVIRARAATLRALSHEKRRSFWERNRDVPLPALAEGDPERGSIRLTTRNYIPLRIPWEGPPPADEFDVELVEITRDGVLGRAADGRTLQAESPGKALGPSGLAPLEKKLLTA